MKVITKFNSAGLYLFFLIVVFAGSCAKDKINQPAIDKKLIETYVADSNLTGTFTDSGLWYSIIEPGSAEHPDINDTIEFSYKLYDLEGNLKEANDSLTYPLNGLIVGWQEGVPYIGSGGRIMLIVPSHLAYGSEVLVFYIDLISFTAVPNSKDGQIFSNLVNKNNRHVSRAPLFIRKSTPLLCLSGTMPSGGKIQIGKLGCC